MMIVLHACSRVKRTARLMMTGELMAHGYEAVNAPHARRLEYNLALDELFSEDDATSLMAFTASCALPDEERARQPRTIA